MAKIAWQKSASASWCVSVSAGLRSERCRICVLTKAAPATDVLPQLDKYGFPKDNETCDLLRDGYATLRECLEVSIPRDYALTSSDPIAVKMDDGSYCMQEIHSP